MAHAVIDEPAGVVQGLDDKKMGDYEARQAREAGKDQSTPRRKRSPVLPYPHIMANARNVVPSAYSGRTETASDWRNTQRWLKYMVRYGPIQSSDHILPVPSVSCYLTFRVMMVIAFVSATAHINLALQFPFRTGDISESCHL